MKRRLPPQPRFQRAHLVLSAAAGALAGVFISRNFLELEKKIQHCVETDYGVNDPAFARTVGQLMGPQLLGGNRVTPLHNGAEFFPAMLEAIHSAQETITFENFVWWEGRITGMFARALAERARAGVKVHILQDALGCDHLWGESMQALRKAPLQLEIFRFLRLSRINLRTHRKLLVIDGRLGFIGGAGIADDWDGNADASRIWRDMQYRVEGPVVGQLQCAFMDNWMQTHAEVLHGNRYFPELSPVGDLRCHAFKSTAGQGADSARVMLLLSFAAARHRIQIANSYFIPDELIIQTLVQARERGVEIEIITPSEKTDERVVRIVGRSRWGPLLKAGVRFYEYQPCRFHCKYLIVDDCWVSVGSANLDNRSLRINDEANLNILDRGFAAEHARIFEDDKRRSREIMLREWQERSVAERLIGSTAGLLRSQM